MIIDDEGTYVNLDDVDTNDDILDTYDLEDTLDLTNSVIDVQNGGVE